MVGVHFPDINLDRVKGVLIDLDDTLYRYAPCHAYALKCCYEEFEWDMPLETFIETYRTYRNDVIARLSPQGACRSRLFAFQHFLEERKVSQAYLKAKHLDELYWSKFLHKMVIDPQAQAFLEECVKNAIPLCIVSDMIACVQIDKIKKLDIADCIDYLVTSEEAGIEKPGYKIFELALTKLALSPSQTIMVGDSYEKDIVGAMRAGIAAYQVSLHTDMISKQE